MTEADLMQLISKGETLEVEFKSESRGKLSDNDLVEAVVCLANGSTDSLCYLLVGVEDNGKVTGVAGKSGSAVSPSKIEGLIAARTRPSLIVKATTIDMGHDIILVIEVRPQKHVTGTASGKFIRRQIGSDGKPLCLPMDALAIASHHVSIGVADASSQIIPGCSWNDLDPLEFHRFRRLLESGRGDQSLLELEDLELALALGVVHRGTSEIGVTLSGVLVFGTPLAIRRFVPNHEVAFQVFSNTDLIVNDHYHLPILRVLEQVESSFRARISETEIIVGMQRVGVPDYSARSFREAFANAIVHRDFYRLGSVHVQLQDSSLTVSNPGGFPFGVHQGNILVTPPRPRNPLLADVLKRAGIVDRTARGIDTIFLEQLRNGRPAPSYAMSDENNVIVTIPGGAVRVGFVSYLTERRNDGKSFSLDDLLVLNDLYELRKADTKTLALTIQKPEREVLSTLHRLVEMGIVEERGARRGRLWHLAVDVYRQFGDRTAYIRQRGFDAIQQQAMVEQYLKTHGKITRAEVAELCKISLPQAYRLLQALVKHGIAAIQGGKGRGVYYIYRSE